MRRNVSLPANGGLVSVDTDLVTRVGMALNFGFYGSREARAAGMNGKMSEYNAAVGLAELDGWAQKRQPIQAVGNAYRQEADCFGLADRFVLHPEISIS